MDQNHMLVLPPSADWDIFSLWARHMASQMIIRNSLSEQLETSGRCCLTVMG